MTNGRGRAVGGYFMRLFGGLAIILGILGLVGAVVQGNVIGMVLSVIFIVVGALLLMQSSRIRRTNTPL